jgi:hypothetical protein
MLLIIIQLQLSTASTLYMRNYLDEVPFLSLMHAHYTTGFTGDVQPFALAHASTRPLHCFAFNSQDVRPS